MWEQYKKTFAGMQAMISLVSCGIYLMIGHSLSRMAVFFVVMQLGAVIGSLWGVRLKAWMNRRADALPLRSVDY